MDKTIKTRLKFTRSLKTKAWIGFVSKNEESGYIRGVRESDKCQKSICMVPSGIAPIIEEGVLYDVELSKIPHHRGKYIVVSAEPHAFKATVERVIVTHAIYMVNVKFGNKTITYDPLEGKVDSVRTIGGVVKVLESRKDIMDQMFVIDEFIKSANAVLTVFTNDGYYTKDSSKGYKKKGKTSSKA